MSLKWRLILILILAAAALGIDLYPKIPLKMGLDLVGGTHLTLVADMSRIEDKDKTDALESVKQIISRRVDLYGVTEPVIQTSAGNGTYRLIVELPGIKDVNQAVSLIGQTAQLDFREDQTATAGAASYNFIPTGLSGKDLKKASVSFSQSAQLSGQPVVDREFTADGGKKFGEITSRNVGRPLAIFLDNIPLTTPVVNEPILDGRAVI